MKGLLGLCFLVLCLLVPAVATASHSDGTGPKYDKVDGTVEDVFPSTLHVNAISNPDGTEPRGHVWYELPEEAPGFPEVQVAGPASASSGTTRPSACGSSATSSRASLPKVAACFST